MTQAEQAVPVAAVVDMMRQLVAQVILHLLPHLKEVMVVRHAQAPEVLAPLVVAVEAHLRSVLLLQEAPHLKVETVVRVQRLQSQALL